MSGESTAGAAVEFDQDREPRDGHGATGASQGLLDRKEVLGGESFLRWVRRGPNCSSGGWGRPPLASMWGRPQPRPLLGLLLSLKSSQAEPAPSAHPGVIAGGLVGLIFAVCLVGFMLYRMKKKDEGSYSLEEPKQANGGAYQKPSKQEEFYA